MGNVDVVSIAPAINPGSSPPRDIRPPIQHDVRRPPGTPVFASSPSVDSGHDEDEEAIPDVPVAQIFDKKTGLCVFPGISSIGSDGGESISTTGGISGFQEVLQYNFDISTAKKDAPVIPTEKNNVPFYPKVSLLLNYRDPAEVLEKGSRREKALLLRMQQMETWLDETVLPHQAKFDWRITTVNNTISPLIFSLALISDITLSMLPLINSS